MPCLLRHQRCRSRSVLDGVTLVSFESYEFTKKEEGGGGKRGFGCLDEFSHFFNKLYQRYLFTFLHMD